MQKLCYILFNGIEDDDIDEQTNVYNAFDSLLDAEKGYFEASFSLMTAKQ